ncbi:unnamed protein product [Dovyalis caffra]|uniref:Uncharacterized protein n=1 Tax=Dovyalis caffra TaxID=77055 RepID=A0AAV1RQJ6_9ROSI|nr:unnamed protein product [Dovyalis caffra]
MAGLVGFDSVSGTRVNGLQFPEQWPSSATALSVSYTLQEDLLRRICLEEDRMNEVYDLWKTIKDQLVLPLYIQLSEKTGATLPPCFMRLSSDLKPKILELIAATVLQEWHALVRRCRLCVRMMIYGSSGLWRSLDMPLKRKVLTIGKSDLVGIRRLRRTNIRKRRQDRRPTCRISSTPEAVSLPNSGLLFWH